MTIPGRGLASATNEVPRAGEKTGVRERTKAAVVGLFLHQSRVFQPRYGADMRCSTYLFRCYSHLQYSGLSESAPATNKGDITRVSSTKWRMEVRGGSLYLTAAGQALKSCVFPPLADTILDPRLQDAYKMPLRGDALRTRGATKTPGARTAGRRASVRRTQRCARRDCHAILCKGRRPHPL